MNFPFVAPRSAAISWFGDRFSSLGCSVRRSIHSFSGWVAVVSFSSFSAAARFRAFACTHWSFPFCAIRRSIASGWFVSVPCSIPRRQFPGRLHHHHSSGGRSIALLFWIFSRLVGSFRSVGFSGSRRLSNVGISALQLVAKFVDPSASVFVGCARGADAVARSCFPDASVFRVASGRWGSGRASFARRSAAVISAVDADGLWISFPSGSCPTSLMPTSSWPSNAQGSGSWGSLALAAGSGLSCLVFTESVPTNWGFRSLGGCWWFLPGFCQLSIL